jgi:hypothetical protein
MLGKAVARIASTLAATLLFVTVSVTSGHAQATNGKVQGRVISGSGQPIASAQVSIDGTSLGNITNDEGFYFINEVPAGLHTIRAQSIGFQTTAVTEQRIQAGQTQTINFTLQEAAVELEALLIEGERNPLVPRDQVSSKSIVTGETIDNLPVDDADDIITLQPGIVTIDDDDFSIRGSREDEHGVYVDGVPVRNLRTGEAAAIELGTNSLAQVDVTVGGIAARYGNAQSGLINYVTRTGGSQLGGSLSFTTNRLAPESIRGGFTRLEASIGGPVPIGSNLSFFLSTTLEGDKYGNTNQNNPYPVYVAAGVDTTIRIARTGVIDDDNVTDSVDVVIPEFVEWDNGPTIPTGVDDEVNLTGRLEYGIGRGSRVNLTYYYNRDQQIERGTAAILNNDAWRGDHSTANMLTAGGYFLLLQSSERALALDLKASYQRDWRQTGILNPSYLEGHLFPAFGFNASNLDFVADPDDYPVTEEMILALRSGVLPVDQLAVLPGRSDLAELHTLAGVDEDLRLNPFAKRNDFNIGGIGNNDQEYQRENRWYFTGTADWQVNRFNRLWLGGELTKANSETMEVPLYDGRPAATQYSPTTGGLFLQNRLDIGDVVLEGGVRMDYYSPDGAFPRVPGFVTNVPDSLKADYYQLLPGDEPWDERLELLEDCGGAATAASRTRDDGTVVCKNNFVEAKTRTTFSPKLAVSFPVTATSTFRLSYNQSVQPTALTTLLRFTDLDLAQTNTNQLFGREIDLPNTVAFEAGYRQVFGGNTVVDAAVFSRTTRNALSYRKIQYTHPVSGASVFINTLTNSDFSLNRGVDLKVDRRLGEIADLSLSYSYLDAKGTGSDPTTYTSVIFRNTSNLSLLTGEPVGAPEMLLTLDQSRAHNVAGTLSMLLGTDYMEDSRIGNAILGGLGIFATGQIASGLPYTRIINRGGGQRSINQISSGELDEALNASRGPMLKRFDLRLTKGFDVFGTGARFVADMRNPFNIANTNQVFNETGTIINDQWYDQALREDLLNEANATTLSDRVIADWPENEVNRYMLARAEERFGNGDGVFTVEEQTNAWGTYFNYASNGSAWRMRTSNQSLRLGLEFIF